MNDSFRTNVFVQYHPETIACACIYLAARQLQVPFMLNILVLHPKNKELVYIFWSWAESVLGTSTPAMLIDCCRSPCPTAQPGTTFLTSRRMKSTTSASVSSAYTPDPRFVFISLHVSSYSFTTLL